MVMDQKLTAELTEIGRNRVSVGDVCTVGSTNSLVILLW